MQAIILLIFIPFCFGILGVGTKQKVTVVGTLRCNNKPAGGVKVKLYKKDLLINRMLAESITDTRGMFLLMGNAKQISNVKPLVTIYHKCNYDGPCRKKYTREISSKQMAKGKSGMFYQFGEWDLAMNPIGQTIDCFKWRNPSVPDYSD
ncbi:hypothetical protein Y032_0874g2809 [Ancylostoma ceylanicum]|nr:hypothetical protein Y032_0874g2809 [Ancylostoma ceylanicum]